MDVNCSKMILLYFFKEKYFFEKYINKIHTNNSVIKIVIASPISLYFNTKKIDRSILKNIPLTAEIRISLSFERALNI